MEGGEQELSCGTEESGLQRSLAGPRQEAVGRGCKAGHRGGARRTTGGRETFANAMGAAEANAARRSQSVRRCCGKKGGASADIMVMVSA